MLEVHEQKQHTNEQDIINPSKAFLKQEKKPLSRLRLGILLGAITVVVLAASALAVYLFAPKSFERLVNTLENLEPSAKNADMGKQVLESLFSIKTADVSVDLTTSGPMFASPEGSSLHSTIEGSFDPKGNENGNFEVSLATDATSQNIIPLNLAVINVGSTTYFQLQGLPSIFIISDALNDRWINVSSNVEASGLALPRVDKQDVLKDISENNPFTVGKKLGIEKVGDVKTAHYEIHVDVNKEVAMFQALAKTFHAGISDAEIEKIVASTSLSKLEVWVGLGDFFPYKIQTNIIFKENKEVNIRNGSLAATITLRHLNEDQHIAAPKDAITLPAALTPSFQGFVGGLLDKALSSIFQDFPEVQGLPDSDGDGVNDASEAILGTDPHKKDTNGNGVSDKEELSAKLGDARDNDNDGLSDGVETLFGTDPKDPDTDNDGYADGNEVLNGFNPKGSGALFPENSK